MMKNRVQAKQKYNANVKSTFNKELNVHYVFDSTLEADYYKKMRFDSVDFIISQPAPLFYLLDGKRTRYTPDFEIIHNNQRFFDEVKYQKDTSNQDFQDKRKFLEREYRKQDAQFRVITEKDIYDNCNIINISMLLPCFHHSAPLHEFRVLVADLENRAYSLVEMNDIAKQRNIALQIVKRSIAHKLFSVDITQPYQNWQLIINEQASRENDE